jgi:hypothetical protein
MRELAAKIIALVRSSDVSLLAVSVSFFICVHIPRPHRIADPNQRQTRYRRNGTGVPVRLAPFAGFGGGPDNVRGAGITILACGGSGGAVPGGGTSTLVLPGTVKVSAGVFSVCA